MHPCQHEKTEIRKKPKVNGSWVVAKQCLYCGSQAGQELRKDSVAFETLIEWDWALIESWTQERAKLVSEKKAEIEKGREGSPEWWAMYNAYLLTPEWRRIRAKVMKRAGGVCEGCGDFPPVQAHHLTYKRVTREMMFDLVALCKRCHDACHSDKQGSDWFEGMEPMGSLERNRAGREDYQSSGSSKRGNGEIERSGDVDIF